MNRPSSTPRAVASWNDMAVGLARFTASCRASTRAWISPPRMRPRSDFASCSHLVRAPQLVARAASSSACATSSRIRANSAGDSVNGDDGTAYIRSMFICSSSRCCSPHRQRADGLAERRAGVLADVDLHVVGQVAVLAVPRLRNQVVRLVPVPRNAVQPTTQARAAFHRLTVMRVWVAGLNLRRSGCRGRHLVRAILDTGGRRLRLGGALPTHGGESLRGRYLQEHFVKNPAPFWECSLAGR